MVPRCFDSRARRTVLAAVFAGLSGCFLDSPFVDIDDGGLTSTDGGAASSGQSEGDASTTGASTAGSAGASQGSQDASSGGSQGDSSSAEGSVGVCGDGAIDGDEVCDDGNDVIADGCEPDCTPSSGQPYWTVVEPGGGFPDGAYVITAAPDGDVVVGGARGTSATTSNPWVARYAADGTSQWNDDAAAGDGADVIRGLALIDDDVVAVGSFDAGAGLLHGLLRVFDGGGGEIWSDGYGFEPTSVVLLGVAPRSAGGWFAGGSTSLDTEASAALLGYEGASPAWLRTASTPESGTLEGQFGTIFAIAEDLTGRAVAVGTDDGGADKGSDAWVAILEADGTVLREAAFGGSGDDDFVDLVLDGSTVHVVGRHANGSAASDLWLARLQVDDTIQLGWQALWSDASFTVGNGLVAEGGTRYIAGATSPGGELDGYDARVLRWDGEAAAPTWVVPFDDLAPGTDFASDLTIAADGTVVVCGAVTPAGTGDRQAWIRKLAP